MSKIATELEHMLKEESKNDPFKAEILNSNEMKVWLKGFLAGKNGQSLTSDDTIKIIKMIEAMKETIDYKMIPLPSLTSPSSPYIPTIMPVDPNPLKIGEKPWQPNIWCTTTSNSTEALNVKN